MNECRFVNGILLDFFFRCHRCRRLCQRNLLFVAAGTMDTIEFTNECTTKSKRSLDCVCVCVSLLLSAQEFDVTAMGAYIAPQCFTIHFIL